MVGCCARRLVTAKDPDKRGLVYAGARDPMCFAFSFDMPETGDSEGEASLFAVALPMREPWTSRLAVMTLSGPPGTVTLDADGDIPMAIVRDPRTRGVRGIFRGMPGADSVQPDTEAVAGTATGREVLYGDSIPGAAD